MAEDNPYKWHGFTNAFNLVKATIALSIGVGTVLWAILTWALDVRFDERYAPKSITTTIEQNGQLAKTVDSKLNVLSDVVVGEAVFNKRLQYCNAENPQLKQELDRQLGQLIRQYETLTGNDPYVPSC